MYLSLIGAKKEGNFLTIVSECRLTLGQPFHLSIDKHNGIQLIYFEFWLSYFPPITQILN